MKRTLSLNRVAIASSAIAAYCSVSFLAASNLVGEEAPQQLKVHPGVRFVSPDEAELTWETDQPGIASVAYRSVSQQVDSLIHSQAIGGTMHRVTLTELQPGEVYRYQISMVQNGKRRTSKSFEFDNGMNYSPPRIHQDDKLHQDDQPRPPGLDALVNRLHHAGGYAVVDEALVEPWAELLAQNSSMTVVASFDDDDDMQQQRQRWYQQGVYGIRFTAKRTAEIPTAFANLVMVTSDGLKRGTRMLAPTGTLVCVGTPPTTSKLPTSQLNWERIDEQLFATEIPNDAITTRWDHQYGSVANQSFSGETLNGVEDANQLEVRWLGRPGADFGIDRNPRMPAPLAVGGRLFHQGMNRMIALDAFNGAVLWSLELPQLRRVNIPRDCSNWCADDQHIYAAAADRLWVIDAASGEMQGTMLLPEPYGGNSEAGFDWGYIANTKDTVLGTAVTRGSQYEEYWSKPAWYDGKDDQATAKVCGRAIVAYDKRYGDVRWTRDVDAVIHATMTVAGDRLVFVEVEHPELRQLSTGKLTNQQISDKASVVCLDLKTGRELWTQQAPAFAPNQVVAFGLADDQQFMLETSGDSEFQFTSFDLTSGERRWTRAARWPEDHHGAHMQHAVLMNDKVYVQPHILDAKTGEIVQTNTLGKRRGCATPVGTGNTIIYRGGGGPLSFWSLERGGRSEFTRLRPSCWLSTIPAQGMLFSPEAGGGCSCGGWMECSIGFAPKKEADNER